MEGTPKQPSPEKQQHDNLAKQIALAKATGKTDLIKKLTPAYKAARQKLEAKETNAAKTAVANITKNPKEVSNIADETVGEEEDNEQLASHRLNKNMIKKESTQIANFLKAISKKNYAQADKYLQGTVESKLRASINKAIQNSK